MHDLTRAEITPLEPGVERFLCLWPDCDWFVDWDYGSWLEANADQVPVDPQIVAAHGTDLMGVMGAIAEATALHYARLVEASLVAHMDAEHAGWTMEALEAHAAAYSVVGLLEGLSGHG